MSSFLDIFTDYTLRNVALGTLLLGLGAGAVGTFALLRKQSLIGDAISHAALPGIVLAYILTGLKTPAVLLSGAALAGFLGTLLIIVIIRSTRIDTDGAQGIVLSVFFGLGLMLLTYVQKLPNSSQAGLDRFIFGQAATIIARDVWIILATELAVCAALILFWKELKVETFDTEFFRSLGFSSRRIDAILMILIVSVIVVGLQSVGVILISALLVVPAAAARQWTDRLGIMVFVAAIFGGLSGAAGSIVSSSVAHLPTGPVIVLMLTGGVMFSFLFGPRRGLLSRLLSRRRNRFSFAQDRLLENMYRLAVSHGREDYLHGTKTIELMDPSTGTGSVRIALRALRSRGLVAELEKGGWALTPEGIEHIKNERKGAGHEF